MFLYIYICVCVCVFIQKQTDSLNALKGPEIIQVKLNIIYIE